MTNLIRKKAESDNLFARQRLFEFGNKPNTFLVRLARNSPRKAFISAISDEDQICQTNNRSMNAFRNVVKRCIPQNWTMIHLPLAIFRWLTDASANTGTS